MIFSEVEALAVVAEVLNCCSYVVEFISSEGRVSVDVAFPIMEVVLPTIVESVIASVDLLSSWTASVDEDVSSGKGGKLVVLSALVTRSVTTDDVSVGDLLDSGELDANVLSECDSVTRDDVSVGDLLDSGELVPNMPSECDSVATDDVSMDVLLDSLELDANVPSESSAVTLLDILWYSSLVE